MHKKHLIVTLTSVVTCGTALAICLANKSSLLSVTGADTWFHYSEVPATCQSYGVKEYWTNCKGNTQITEPSGGEINDQGQPSAAAIQAIIDTYGVDDERILPKAEHNYVDTVVADKIGYYGTVCSVCGEAGALSSNLMTFADIDFTLAQYGAEGGKWGSNVQPTAKTMTFEITEGHAENEIKLPKINFSLYQRVTFALSGNVWDARVGLETGSYAFPYSASGIHTGTLTFTRSGLEVNASLECSDGVNQNIVITDSDIVNGDKSVSLFMTADDPYRSIIVELTGLIDSCTHNFVADANCIGKEVCSLCGIARGVESPTFDFTSSLYGAYDTYEPWGINVAQDGWVAANGSDKIKFVNYTNGDICVYHLPKIYFAGYSSLTVTITVNYTDVVYALVYDFASSYQVPFAGYQLTVVFDNISESSMTVKILDAFSTVQVQATCTDTDVLSGNAGFLMYAKGSGNVGWDEFSNFTFVQ